MSTTANNLLTFVGLIRLKQWIKNLFLFIPVFFAGEFFVTGKVFLVGLGFLSFCFVASAIYILNDINDIASDRLHPEKSKRPIPSGKISITNALVILFILGTAGFTIAWLVNRNFMYILLTYFIFNLAYSLGLKRIAILDLMIVATGFVLRVVAGGIIADVYLSHWLIIMVYLLSLFIVLAKRRDDILEFQKSGVALRRSIMNYNLEFIHSILTMLSGIIIVSYLMYTISDDVYARFNTDFLYFTTIFVIAGIMRYIQITLVENKSGSPTSILYTDRFIHVTLVGWIISFFVIIYILKI